MLTDKFPSYLNEVIQDGVEKIGDIRTVIAAQAFVHDFIPQARIDGIVRPDFIVGLESLKKAVGEDEMIAGIGKRIASIHKRMNPTPAEEPVEETTEEVSEKWTSEVQEEPSTPKTRRKRKAKSGDA